MKVFLGILLAVGVFVVLVLAVRTMSAPTKPRYFIYMGNRTHHDLEDVGVYYGGTMAAFSGGLVRGGLATYGFVTLPIPDEATVTWSVGVHRYPAEHSLKVKLEGIIPPSPRDMTVWFLIEEDGSVTVKCARDDDHAVNDPLHRSLNRYREKK